MHETKMYSCDARVILSILIGLFLSCNVFAQDVTIKGNVKDAKGEPIIGASILEKELRMELLPISTVTLCFRRLKEVRSVFLT